jgi:hypothetical protein
VEFLPWLVRAIVLTILVNLILRLVTGSRRPTQANRSGPRGPMPASPVSQERVGGTLVQDPQCGTYVIQSRAIRTGSGDQVRYFCSDGCRTAYLAAHPQ